MTDKDFPTKSSIVARMIQKNQPDPNAAFPAMLHRMLTDIDELSKTDSEMAKLKTIVSWLDHGRAFKVHDKNKFISIIMPAFFVRLKYTSFIRQLNTYNFKRVSDEGEDKGALYHENFIRGMPELTANIPKMKKRRSSTAGGSLPRTVSVNMEQQAPATNNRPAQNYPVLMPLQMKPMDQLAPIMPYNANNSLKSLILSQGTKPQMSLPVENPLNMPPFQTNSLMNAPLTSEAPLNIPPLDGSSMDPFGGLNWLDTDDSNTAVEQNYLQRFLDTAAASVSTPYESDDCADFEPVPISPLLDRQVSGGLEPLGALPPSA